MDWLISVFEPYECKAVRSEVRRLIAQHAQLSADSLTWFCMRHIRKNRKAVQELVRAEHVPASRCASFIVMNGAAELVTSGNYHSYRGVLTPIGKDLNAVHSRLCGHMVETGVMPADEAQRARDFVRQEVREMG